MTTARRRPPVALLVVAGLLAAVTMGHVASTGHAGDAWRAEAGAIVPVASGGHLDPAALRHQAASRIAGAADQRPLRGPLPLAAALLVAVLVMAAGPARLRRVTVGPPPTALRRNTIGLRAPPPFPLV